MNNETWTRVDQYLAGQLLPRDEVLEAALRASDAAGLPSINVTPTQGALLQMFARLCGARRILEIGTLGGYSTIWLARALRTTAGSSPSRPTSNMPRLREPTSAAPVSAVSSRSGQGAHSSRCRCWRASRAPRST